MLIQILSINNEILSAFDIGLEVRGIFLDISKAFDKVWYNGLVFKLRQNSLCGEMINILKDFLSYRKQRVDIQAGVPPAIHFGTFATSNIYQKFIK